MLFYVQGLESNKSLRLVALLSLVWFRQVWREKFVNLHQISQKKIDNSQGNLSRHLVECIFPQPQVKVANPTFSEKWARLLTPYIKHV